MSESGSGACAFSVPPPLEDWESTLLLEDPLEDPVDDPLDDPLEGV
jgi:hypothetical protein